MASQSNTEPPPDQDVCPLCLVPVQGAKAAHEAGQHHQAARLIAATALDRWRAHMAAAVLSPVEDTTDTDAAESVIFCDICTEVVPSAAFARHLPSRSHLVSALDIQEFEEQVRLYVDDEDLELLEAPERDGDGPAAKKCDANTTYTCYICAIQVPSAFKAEHERSVHHKTRVALASAAARRTSAYLHQTPIRVIKDNIKMSELLQTYTGIDLKKKNEEVKDVVDKEIEAPVVKKRLTAKKYFTDILPYLQYTEALYTLIIDDSEYVTIKNTNGTYMRVHVANFNGIYSDSGDVNNVRCRMCHGYQYVSYNSEMDHDKLHVMSLGHIRHVLTPIDNVHGIRKIENGPSLCVLCNACMHEHNVENHIFNDIHHTANLAEALKLGRSFKESKDDLKIVIYSSPPIDKTNYMRNPIRGFPHNNLYGGMNVCLPQGGSKPQGGTLFGASSASAGGFSSNTVTIEGFGASTAETTAKRADTGALFSARPASIGFGASTANTGAIDVTTPKASVFGASTAGTGFGLSTSNTANSGPSFGASPASTGFGVNNANTGLPFGASPASTGFGVNNANTGFSFGVTPDSTGFGASTANSTTGTGFGVSTANTGTFGTGTAAGTTFGGTNKSGTIFDNGNTAFGTTAPVVTTNSTSDDYNTKLPFKLKSQYKTFFFAL